MTPGHPIRVDAGGWGATFGQDRRGHLRQLGLGPDGHEAEPTAPLQLYPDAHPCWGDSDPLRQAALRITHHDGTLTTRLRVQGAETSRCDGGEHIKILCRDELFSLEVTHNFRTNPSTGVLAQWIEITNDEPGPVTLFDYDSISPLLLVTDSATITQFGGSGWADEWRWSTQPLHPGNLTLSSLGGVQPHLQRAPFLLVEPDTGPSSRDAIGLSVGWGSNTRFDLDVRPRPDPGSARELRLRAGANPYAAEYVLDPGERFVTPEVAWTWARGGRHEVTERFHRWVRADVLRDPERLRPIVVNNWEATAMDFDESKLVELIGSTGRLGADLFLLDDGWFAPNHPRDDDTKGLGDWDPDPAKLPNGFGPLIAAAGEAGIRFGTWVEPEMVNPDSDLFAAHPDWVVRDRRETRQHRQQLVLDPLRAEVRDFEVGVFDRVLGPNPGIDYLKWDANRPVTEAGSPALPPERQSNFWVDHVHATWQVMDDVVRNHPDVELMLCASGGGRVDHASLRRFHEVWPSDNTDPVARVRMQWAFSHFLPASTMASHVTRWGGRPLEFACAVALSGRFGFDLDLAGLDEQEWAICARAVQLARRTAPLVQLGEVEHLVSPVEGEDRSRAAIAYHGRDGGPSVVFAYQLDDPVGPAPAIRIAGLDAAAQYRVTTTDLRHEGSGPTTSSGADLCSEGFEWPLRDACTALIWELTPAGT